MVSHVYKQTVYSNECIGYIVLRNVATLRSSLSVVVPRNGCRLPDFPLPSPRPLPMDCFHCLPSSLFRFTYFFFFSFSFRVFFTITLFLILFTDIKFTLFNFCVLNFLLGIVSLPVFLEWLPKREKKN